MIREKNINNPQLLELGVAKYLKEKDQEKPRPGIGCSLFLKSALYFTGIEACSWVTVRSLKILDFVYFVIEKNTPRS